MKVTLPSGKQATRSMVWVVLWDGEPDSVWSSPELAEVCLDSLKRSYAKKFTAIPAPLSSVHKAPLLVEDK